MYPELLNDCESAFAELRRYSVALYFSNIARASTGAINPNGVTDQDAYNFLRARRAAKFGNAASVYSV